MALFNDFGKKITSTTQNVVRSTKDMTDIARLNSLIADEQQQVEQLYAQVGKLYYEGGGYDSQTPLGELCLAISTLNERIAAQNEEIRQIRGTRQCPNCGAQLPLVSVFCGRCGAKIDGMEMKSEAPAVAQNICSGCGAKVLEGRAFCTSCGQKQDLGG